jgi:glycosyltransferase involved in cell wall biosynthesis
MPTDTDQGSEIARSTYVVVPAFNEGAAIGDVLAELVRVYPNVVVVDDGSTDGTFDAARAVTPYVLRHALNRGQGAALQTGVDFALRREAKYVVTFDADGQHRVEDIRALLEPLAGGACDVTLGSRFLGVKSQMPRSRRLLLRMAVLFTRITSRLPITDAHNGLRAFTRAAAERLDISMDRMEHASEVLDIIRRCRLRFREVPVQIRYTDYSLGKGQSARDALRVLLHYLIGRAVR